MYTQIILLLFGLATIAAHVLKEPDVNPCIQEYREPTRKFTNGHGFQYLYRRRPLEIVRKRPAKIQNAADVTVSKPAAVKSTKLMVSTTTEIVQDMENVPVTAVSTSKPKTDKVTATRLRRNNTFNAMREKYHINKNKKSTSSDDRRQKREIDNKAIPEAPTLSSDTQIDKKPRTYGMRLFNGQGYSWNLLNEQNKNTYDDTQHISEPAQDSIKSQQTNITHGKTEQENISNIEKETKPKATIEEINNEQKFVVDLPDKAILIDQAPKQNDSKNQTHNNIKDKLNEMFENINKSLSPPEKSKVRTYGMSLKGGTANMWNEIAGAPHIKIQTTVAPVIKETAENKTSTINNDITTSTNNESIGKNNTGVTEDSGQSKESNNKEKLPTDQSYSTTSIPEITFKTTLVPNQKVKRFTEENAVSPKKETDLRDKMEESFQKILKKFLPFEGITSKPNATTEVEEPTSVINENAEIKTSTIINDIMQSINDDSIDQNNIAVADGSGHNKDRNNTKKPPTDQSYPTTSVPEISLKTTLVPNQKDKRYTEENGVSPKKETELRNKMEESFKRILKKFPPFEGITSKPNATTEVEKHDKEPKTYGMNLTGNHGYVWNELTNPVVRYNVGDTETNNATDQVNSELTTNPTTEENEYENSSQPTTKITTSTKSPTTSKVTNNEKDVLTTLFPVTTEITSESTTLETNPLTTEITESTIESKPATTEMTCKSTTIESKPQTTENTSESTTTESKPQTTKITSESTLTESKPQTPGISESTTVESKPQTTEITSEPTTEKQLQTTETSSAPTEHSDKDDKKENTNEEEDNKDKNPIQISLDELLKKNEFWDWLSKWTTTFIEVFNEHLKKMVKFEVAKQLKSYMNNDKDNKNDDKKPTDSAIENKANNTDHETNKNKENDDSKTNPKDNGNSETNTEKKSNKLDPKNNRTSLNVKAKSIYGGAVGNDRVTNIFIFNSNGEGNKTIQSLLDSVNNKNLTTGNPVNTTSDNTGNDDKDKNSEVTTKSTIPSEDKDKTDKDATSNATTSKQTEPSNITSTTMKDLAVEDKQDNKNNDETATDTSTIKSSTINSTNNNKTESTAAEDKITETSKDDTTTVATTDNSTLIDTGLKDVAENVNDRNNSTLVSSSSSGTETTSVKCCNSTDETTTSTSELLEAEKTTAATSNMTEANTEEYECATNDPTELAKLEINIGAKNTDNNNVRKCIPKQKNKPTSGVLAKIGVTLKKTLKSLLNI